MASRGGYLAFILEQLSELEGVTYRPMMGEYLLYCRGRLFGGIYDDRLLIKPVAEARERLPHAPLEAPYPGAKEMLAVEDLEDRTALAALVEAMLPQLPPPKNKK